jgi:hypothetical protein
VLATILPLLVKRESYTVIEAKDLELKKLKLQTLNHKNDDCANQISSPSKTPKLVHYFITSILGLPCVNSI